MYNKSGTVMIREYVVYEGKKFIVEWYYDANGKSTALEYYKKLTAQERIKALQLFKRMGDAGEIKDTTKFNYEGDHLYAFKPKPDRYMCFFFTGKKVIITSAFRKKQQKLPDNEKNRAKIRKQDYENRVKKGDYYDKA
jgi:phage-related protein